MPTVRLVTWALLALVASGAWAQGAAEPAYGYAVPAPTPDQIVQRGLDRLTGFLIGAGDPAPEDTRVFLEQEIAPHFDFAYMAQWAAGPFHRRLDPGQQARLAGKLQALFLDALARNLGSYARPLPRVDVLPARAGGNANETTVDTFVTPDGGYPVRLQFRFYRDVDAWRIFDVSANGASAVAFYRGYFTNLFRRFGPEGALR